MSKVRTTSGVVDDLLSHSQLAWPKRRIEAAANRFIRAAIYNLSREWSDDQSEVLEEMGEAPGSREIDDAISVGRLLRSAITGANLSF